MKQMLNSTLCYACPSLCACCSAAADEITVHNTLTAAVVHGPVLAKGHQIYKPSTVVSFRQTTAPCLQGHGALHRGAVLDPAWQWVQPLAGLQSDCRQQSMAPTATQALGFATFLIIASWVVF